ERASENRECLRLRLIDVAYRPVGDHPGHALQPCGEREQPTPAAGIDSRALRDHDDVIGARGLDRGRSEMAWWSRRRRAGSDIQRDDRPGNAAAAGLLRDIRLDAGELEAIESIAHRTRIECAQPAYAVGALTCGSAHTGALTRCSSNECRLEDSERCVPRP